MSRRALLRLPAAGALAAAVGACTPTSGQRVLTGSPVPTATTDPDAATLAEALAGVLRLVAAYATVPAARADLRRLAGEHDRHAAALRAWPLRPLPSISGSSAGSAAGTATTKAPGAVPVPTVGALAALEASESGRRTAQALRATGELARLLASVAAAEAAHAALLRRKG